MTKPKSLPDVDPPESAEAAYERGVTVSARIVAHLRASLRFVAEHPDDPDLAQFAWRAAGEPPSAFPPTIDARTAILSSLEAALTGESAALERIAALEAELCQCAVRLSAAFDTANGRWSEWGTRAESVCNELEALLNHLWAFNRGEKE